MDFLNSIVEGIKNLPNLIFEGIKAIFIPDTEVIKDQFNSTLSVLKGKIGITVYNLENLFHLSGTPVDVVEDYTISGLGEMKIKFVDYKFLADGVQFFRPYIRGLLVLLLFFFNVRQLMSMFGLDTGEMTGWVNNSRGRDE